MTIKQSYKINLPYVTLEVLERGNNRFPGSDRFYCYIQQTNPSPLYPPVKLEWNELVTLQSIFLMLGAPA